MRGGRFRSVAGRPAEPGWVPGQRTDRSPSRTQKRGRPPGREQRRRRWDGGVAGPAAGAARADGRQPHAPTGRWGRVPRQRIRSCADRGLLTRTADCALPSLYEACHEEPYQPGSPGFATWPATKWPWFGELADRGHLITAVHRGKSLLDLRRGRTAARPDLPRGDHPHGRRRPRLGPAAGSPGRRRAVQHRGPAHGTRAQAAGTEGAAGTAGAVRRDRVAIAARHRRRKDTQHSQRAGAAGIRPTRAAAAAPARTPRPRSGT